MRIWPYFSTSIFILFSELSTFNITKHLHKILYTIIKKII